MPSWGNAPSHASRPRWPLGRASAPPLNGGQATLSLGGAVLSPSRSAPRLLCSQPQGWLERSPLPEIPVLSHLGTRRISSLRPLWAPGSVLEGSPLVTAGWTRAVRHDPSRLLCTEAARWVLLGGQRQFAGGREARGRSAPALHLGRGVSEPRSAMRGGKCPAGQSLDAGPSPGRLPGGEGLRASCRLSLGGGGPGLTVKEVAAQNQWTVRSSQRPLATGRSPVPTLSGRPRACAHWHSCPWPPVWVVCSKFFLFLSRG